MIAPYPQGRPPGAGGPLKPRQLAEGVEHRVARIGGELDANQPLTTAVQPLIVNLETRSSQYLWIVRGQLLQQEGPGLQGRGGTQIEDIDPTAK